MGGMSEFLGAINKWTLKSCSVQAVDLFQVVRILPEILKIF